jgi:hypothetical protein
MPTESRAHRRELRRYQRLSVIVIAVFLVLSGLLAAANSLQGPRLTGAEVNGQGAISRPGQRLVLHANQPVAHVDASKISISPAVPFTATTSGNDITVTLDGMLRYDADYSITVTAKSLYSGATGQLAYAFTTPDISVYSLIRDTGSVAGDEPDRIVRNALSGSGEGPEVFTAGRIQEYAVTGSILAVVVLDDDDRTSLVVRDMSTGVDTRIHVPRDGTIRYLRSSGASGLFGFTVAGKSEPDGTTSPTTLFVYDPATPNGVAREITGFAGAELPAVAWAFVPSTTSAVVQDYDQQLYLVDTSNSDAAPSPLGRHAEVHGFIPGTAELVVSDLEESTRIDLAAAQTTAFTPRIAEVDPSYYPGKRLMLNSDNDFVQVFGVPDDKFQYSTSALFLVDGSGTREIYRPAATTRIRNVCLSPNGTIAAVETFAEGKQNDAYPNVPSYLPMTTYFVDLTTLETTRSVDGWMPDWCQ